VASAVEPAPISVQHEIGSVVIEEVPSRVYQVDPSLGILRCLRKASLERHENHVRLCRADT